MSKHDKWVKKCMRNRVEGRRLAGRPRKTWVSTVGAYMDELEKTSIVLAGRNNVMKRKSNPIRKRTVNQQ